uniref:Uncharacterized protein n=1 Tax=Skeletonema marinoi TaxID=267567 RepID=A0A7S2LX91_9STRA
MHNARCFEDKFQAISVTVTLLNWSGNVPAAVELIRTTLSSLDEELPSAVTPTVVKKHLDNTKKQLALLTDDTLLSYLTMVDPSKLFAVQLLVKLYGSLTLIGERATLRIIPLKVIQLSLTYGMSPHSPSAFAQYGNYLALIRYEFEEGYRYVKLALSLMKKIPSRAHDSTTMFWSTHTRIHIEPMQSSIECYLDAYKAAMKSGNTYAVSSSSVYNNCCLWSGKELNAVVDSMKDTMKESKYHKNFVALTLMLPMLRVALRLIGQSDAPAPQQENLTNAFGETFSEGDNAGKYATLLHTMYFAKLSEALLFRELNQAEDAAEKYFSVDRFVALSPVMFFGKFYSGLVSFWVARETDDNDRKESKKWIKRGVECKDKIEKLSVSASTWNFENKLYLLQAEEQFCSRNFETAETLYDAAILSSKMHKFVNEEALANELAGHFYLETGRRNKSVHYFSRAFDKYNEWGAVAKASALTEYLDESER